MRPPQVLCCSMPEQWNLSKSDTIGTTNVCPLLGSGIFLVGMAICTQTARLLRKSPLERNYTAKERHVNTATLHFEAVIVVFQV